MSNPTGINQYTKGGRSGIGSRAKVKSASKKLTIQGAAKSLASRGLTLGAGKFDMKTRSTSYAVTDKRGVTRQMSAKRIARFGR